MDDSKLINYRKQCSQYMNDINKINIKDNSKGKLDVESNCLKLISLIF